MEQALTVFVPLSRPDQAAGVLRMAPGEWLPAPCTRTPDDAWIIRLRAGMVSHPVLCAIGDVREHDGAVWRPVSWQPCDALGRVRARDHMLPQFSGDLGLVIHPLGTLVLTGSYDPPGGGVGAAVDRAGMDRVAGASARNFLNDVARQLRITASAPLRQASTV